VIVLHYKLFAIFSALGILHLNLFMEIVVIVLSWGYFSSIL